MNGRTTYHAKIIKPDGEPLESANVSFRFTVLNNDSSCILYVENYTAVNMAQSRGVTSFSLGSGVRAFPVSGTSQSFQNIFDNSTTAMPCQAAGVYNPGSNDIRNIVMQFNDGHGWQTMPAMAINAVPYAMFASTANDAKTLNGKADTAFVQTATLAALNCQSNEAIKFNGATFSCIAVVGGAGGGLSSVTTSGTVLTTGGTASAPVISITAATMSSDGYLTASDYAEFKAKLGVSQTQIVTTLGYAPVSGSAVNAQIQSSQLSGDVSGTVASTVVQTVGGKTSAQVATSVDETLTASSSSVANALVKRNSSGNITVNDIYANASKLNFVDIFKPSTSFNIRLQAPASLANSLVLSLPTTSGTTGQILSTDGSGNLSWITQTSEAASITALTSNVSSLSSVVLNLENSVTASFSSIVSHSSAIANLQSDVATKITSSSAAIAQVLGYVPAVSGSTLYSNIIQGNSDLLLNPYGGNVGIGTLSPSGSFDVQGGNAASATNISMVAQNSTSGNTAGGSIYLTAGNANATTFRAVGGGIILRGGNGAGVGMGMGVGGMRGGPITMYGGAGSPTGGTGGHVSLIGGVGGSVSGAGGSASLQGGNATSGTGGSASVYGGATSEGWGGNVSIGAGSANSQLGISYGGGSVGISGGNATGTGMAGYVSLRGGHGNFGNYGHIYLQNSTGKVGVNKTVNSTVNYHLDVSGTVGTNNLTVEQPTREYLTLLNTGNEYSTSTLANIRYILKPVTGHTIYGEAVDNAGLSFVAEGMTAGSEGLEGSYAFDGKVGIGTETPQLKLHVFGTNGNGNRSVLLSLNDSMGSVGNGAALEFAYSSSKIVNAQIYAQSNSGGGGSLHFATVPADGENPVTALTISRTGNLSVSGQILPDVTATRNLGSGALRWNSIYLSNAPDVSSDARLKKDIRNSDLGLDFVNTLRPVSWLWKDNQLGTSRHYGVIAQEAESAITKAKGHDSENSIVVHNKETDSYSVRYTELISPMIKAVQELYSKVNQIMSDSEAKDQKIQELQQENQVMKQRLEKIEKDLQKLLTKVQEQ